MKRLELKNFTISDGEHTLKASVPGDISLVLLSAGIIPDPFFADNFKSLAWIHKRDWVYTTIFSGEELDGEITELIFEGVDVFSEIYLNGELLGETNNAFLKYVFDVSGKIKDKEKLLKATREKRQVTYKSANFSTGTLQASTSNIINNVTAIKATIKYP